jgi:anti-anti-sigma regulatory factor
MGAAFKIEEKDGANVIKCPAVIEMTTDLEESTKKWQELGNKVHIVDFSGVVDFKERAYRPFILFIKAIKSSGKRFFAINASPELNVKLSQAGLSGLFPIVKDVNEAIMKAKSHSNESRPTMDVKFLNSFVTSTKSVLTTQCNVHLLVRSHFALGPKFF